MLKSVNYYYDWSHSQSDFETGFGILATYLGPEIGRCCCWLVLKVSSQDV